MKIAKVVAYVLLFIVVVVTTIFVINFIRMDFSLENAEVVSQVRKTLNRTGRSVSWIAFASITRAELGPRLLRDFKTNKPIELKKGEYYLVSFDQTLWEGPSPTYVVDPSTREIIGSIPGI
ncbi:MAG: hypothetical protein BWY11_02331 [Firmicutes bacterium ADurb.Bin182]|nr:MAG: hypothetical protein BWY11_02331 [Firmicutes bacterium ADurb.Bin182]